MTHDADCANSASLHMRSAESIGFSSVVGVPVVGYRSTDNRRPPTYLSLAPSLGCEIMDKLELQFGNFGIPTLMIRSRITSFKPGEPDKSLFELPPGYKIQNTSR